MADQKISQLTEKQTVVGNDIVPILDSENNNANKKAKLSALAALSNYTASTPLDITNKVISIPQAGVNDDGYLSSANWVTFNSKASTQKRVIDESSTTPSLDISTSGFYNQLYIYTQPLTSLTLSNSYPDSNTSQYRYETEIQFTTDSTFTFTATGLANKWLGVSAPSFDASTSYVIVVKNGYAVCSKVGA